MAAVGAARDVTPAPCPPSDVLTEDPGGAAPPPLDCLPLELLMAVASWLDWRSVLSLERCSGRCRDAVALHLGRLRTFRVTKDELGGAAPAAAQLAELLCRLTALRQLHVQLTAGWMTSPELLDVLVAASESWTRLERLTLRWTTEGLEPALLGQLCANCVRLRDVTLSWGAGDAAVEAVLAARPDLQALRVVGDFYPRPRGAFVARLPAGLRRLALDCTGLRPAAVADVARCGELRCLKLLKARRLRAGHLSAALAGCPRLERLTVTERDQSLSDCLPPAGLPTVRHLDLTGCHLTDADLRRLVERLPRLESVCLARCRGSTPQGLALLGQLSALRSLNLVGAGGVSDWVLACLCAAPLVELQLGDGGVAFSVAVTAEGLLTLHQSCPTLRGLTLWADSELAERVECGPGADGRRLLRWLTVRLRKMIDLAMFAKMVPSERQGRLLF